MKEKVRAQETVEFVLKSVLKSVGPRRKKPWWRRVLQYIRRWL